MSVSILLRPLYPISALASLSSPSEEVVRDRSLPGIPAPPVGQIAQQKRRLQARVLLQPVVSGQNPAAERPHLAHHHDVVGHQFDRGGRKGEGAIPDSLLQAPLTVCGTFLFLLHHVVKRRSTT